MVNLKEVQALLTKQAKTNPASGGILARLAAVINEAGTSGKALASSSTQQVRRLLNNVVVQVVILELEKKKMKTGGDMTDYRFMILGLGNQPVSAADGRRISDRELELVVHCEQPMNEIEAGVYKRALDDAKVAAGDPRRKRTKRQFQLGHASLVKGSSIYATVFGPPFKDGETTLNKGQVCLIRGIQPKQQYKMHPEPGELGEPDYGLKWEITELIRDPNSSTADFAAVWRMLVQDNVLPNVSTRGGFGPHNMDAEEVQQVADWTRKGQMKAQEKWKASFWSVPKPIRADINNYFVVPLGRRPGDVEPYHLVNRQSVLIQGIKWSSDEWTEQMNDKDKTLIRTARFNAEVQVYSEGEGHEKAIAFMTLSSSRMKERFNAFGVVSTPRWKEVAVAFMPQMGGFIVGKVDLQTTKDLQVNDENINTLHEDGTYEKGFAFGVAYDAEMVLPDIARGVVLGGYEVNSEAARFLVRAVYGTDDLAQTPHATAVELATANPLNKVPGEPVINLLEATKAIPPLQREGYRFYVVYFVEKRDVMERYRSRIRAGPGHLDKFSSLMMEDSGEDEFLGFPRPKYSNTNSFCVFAVRQSEVERVLAPAPEMTAAEFTQAVLELQSTRDKREQQRAAQMQAHLDAGGAGAFVPDDADVAVAEGIRSPVREQPQPEEHHDDAAPERPAVHKGKNKKAPEPTAPAKRVKRGKKQHQEASHQESEQDLDDDLPAI